MDAPSAPAETHPFQAEVAELLNLVVHSVYSETDIFLRELISNASDACDKLRYEAIARPELLAGDDKLAIRIKPDKAGRTLVISDSGIGMDRQELLDNLGTLARSGTKAFLKSLAEAKEGMGLIGQFGIGFYSAFMVADRIEVVSRRAGSAEAWVWSSAGGAGFEIVSASEAQAARVPRGTEVALHLKQDAGRYLEAYEIERLVKTWSDHILFPIELVDETNAKGGEARQINAASALWQRPKSELTPEDYSQAYRTIAMAFDEPALTLHYKVEGRQAYAVLLFVPTTPPFDLGDPARKGRIKLYVRRVFITDDADLLPPWLRFVRGVVDSEDLPLNISREMLQNNPQVTQIRNGLIGRVLGELEKRGGQGFRDLRQGVDRLRCGDEGGAVRGSRTPRQAARAVTLCDHGGGGLRSLKQYVADLKPNQTEIYYLVGESAERIRSNPKLEAARARGIEVLLLTDPVDAFWTMMPQEFDGKKLKSLSQGDVDFGLVPLEGQAAEQKTASDEDAAVLKAVKQALADQVSDVRASQRLTESAACLVASAQGRDRELERLLARTNRGTGAKPILELNMGHALVQALANALGEKRDADVSDIAALLLDQAHILDGEVPDDPAAFARRLNDFVVRGLRGPT